MAINEIVEFIKTNNDYFYEKIKDFYIEKYFQDIRGERGILISINNSNCRYNACLIFTILNFIKINNININDILDIHYSEFQILLISNFLNPFFQDPFTEDQIDILKKFNNINEYNEYIIIFLFELEETYNVSHMINFIKEDNKNLLIDSYGNIEYKRVLESRSVTPFDETKILNQYDEKYHKTIDSYILFIPYFYLEGILKKKITESTPTSVKQSANLLSKSPVKKQNQKSLRNYLKLLDFSKVRQKYGKKSSKVILVGGKKNKTKKRRRR